MALPDSIRAQPTELMLLLHTAVRYTKDSSAGIAITQHTSCASTGRASPEHLLRSERKCKIGFTRSKLSLSNTNTAKRAHLLALTHALDLARKVVERDSGALKTSQVRKVVVFCESRRVVNQIERYINDASGAIVKGMCREHRPFVESVLVGIRKFLRYDLELDISFTDGKNRAMWKAREVARMMERKAAKRNGPKGPRGCNDCCRNLLHVSRSGVVQAWKDAVRRRGKYEAMNHGDRTFKDTGDGKAVGEQGTLDLAVRPKDSNGVVRHEEVAGDLGTFELVIREQQPAADIEEEYVIV